MSDTRAEYQTESVVMTAAECLRFELLETQIQDNLFAFRQVAAALIEIHDNKLYRQKYSSFENYLKLKWSAIHNDISRTYAWRLMESERTIQAIERENVANGLQSVANWQQNPLPTSESQTRPLNALPLQGRPAAYALAVEANHGQRPTGRQVAEVVAAVQTSPKDVTDSRIARLDTSKTPVSDTTTDADEAEENERVRTVKRRGFTAQGVDFKRQCIYGFYFMPANPAKGWAERRINIWINFATLEEVGCVMPTQDELLEYKRSGGLSTDVALYLKGKQDIANANAERDKKRKDSVSPLQPMTGFFPEEEPEEQPPAVSFLSPELADNIFSEAGL